MSKSKGNTIDPIDLLDGIELDDLVGKSTKGLMLAEHQQKIEKYLRKNYPKGISAYGADAVRFTFASLATFSRTLNFDLSRCEGYRNFCNKLWNASRFVLLNSEGFDCGLASHSSEACSTGEYLNFSSADRWISNEFERTLLKINRGFQEYRFDQIATALYQFVWDEFCDWYVEIAKLQLEFGEEPQRRATRRTLIRTLEKILRIAHPVIPFITEELWQKVAPIAGVSGDSIMRCEFPVAGRKQIDDKADEDMTKLKEIVTACRSLKSSEGVRPSERWPIYISGDREFIERVASEISVLTKSSEVICFDSNESDLDGYPRTTSNEYLIVLKIDVDPKLERVKLESQRNVLEVELRKEQSKLENKNFTERAPATVVNEVKARVQDRERRITELTEQIARLIY